mgnify:FL=1
MPYFSDDIIEEVRSRNDIVDVIGQYVHLTKKGSTYFGLCPFHNEKTGSFSVSPNKQMYYCFGCGAGGNVFTFMMQYETLPSGRQWKPWRTGRVLPCQSRNILPHRRERQIKNSGCWRSTKRQPDIFIHYCGMTVENMHSLISRKENCLRRP